MNLTFDLNLRVPSHTTVLNWVKKQGLANFRDKTFFNSRKWIIILDESIQFGNKKLLAALAVPADGLPDGRALCYSDLVPLILKSSESWTADVIVAELHACIDPEQILYVVSDNGNNFKKTYGLMGLTHIEDVGHKFSWIIKEIYEKNDDFELYTKQLAKMRGTLALSRYSHLIPPNQRIVSRFMNLTPLFKWGCKMIELLEKGALTDQEKEKVAFVSVQKEFIQQTFALLNILNSVQKTLKNKGFNESSVTECRLLLNKIGGTREDAVKLMIDKYFDDTLAKMGGNKTVLCSSDILESCFGKYKSVVKANKTVGITDLCLCISALLSNGSRESTEQAMCQIKTAQIKDWKDKNIGETLFEKRNKFYKKTG